jgi:hypothetical protein
MAVVISEVKSAFAIIAGDRDQQYSQNAQSAKKVGSNVVEEVKRSEDSGPLNDNDPKITQLLPPRSK